VTAREPTSERQQFIAAVQWSMGYPFSVMIDYCAVIPRNPGGKFEDFVGEVRDH
jgi:hypothetical protein